MLLRQVLLQVRKNAHQVEAADRHRTGRILPARQHTAAAHLGQQVLEHAKDFLHAFFGNLATACCSARLGLGRAPGGAGTLRLAPGRRRAQFRKHADGDQNLVGLGVNLVELRQDVFVEQLEDDQLDLDLHAQAAAGVEKGLAEHPRAHGVGLVFDLLADQGIEADGEVIQGNRVAAHHLGDHGIQGHGFLEFVVLHQGQAVEGHRIQLRRLAYLVLIEGRE
ncbi:hypothetical protein D9M68_545900 [compost metagenome]